MKVIYRVIVGSQSYGTAIQGVSDVDHKFVYMQDEDDLLGFNYREQTNVTKDDTGYEIRRFLELLQTANPTVLEMLYSPEDCIVEKDPVFDILIANRDKFLTKKCLMSFGGYAIAQIQKARGLDKKINWEKERVKRRTPIDFIYAYEDGKTVPINKYLEIHNLKQEYCVLVSLDHFRDCYALYYDIEKSWELSHSFIGSKLLNYKGIALDTSNEIRLSSVPKGEKALTIIYYNKDGYSMHCKDYKEYNDWLANRNTQRYVDNKSHNQLIDSKNLLHTRRLLDMAMEIATTGNISVRRPNAEYLLQIRRGEVSLDEIINQAEKDIKGLDELFSKSNLPDGIDLEVVNSLLLEMRHYGNKSKIEISDNQLQNLKLENAYKKIFNINL